MTRLVSKLYVPEHFPARDRLFALLLFRAVYVIGSFPFLAILYQKEPIESIDNADKLLLFNLFKTQVFLLAAFYHIDEMLKAVV